MYALALHPSLDILMTGGRDSVCRVWDMRTKVIFICTELECLGFSVHALLVCSLGLIVLPLED